jgi:hypothetical protein
MTWSPSIGELVDVYQPGSKKMMLKAVPGKVLALDLAGAVVDIAGRFQRGSNGRWVNIINRDVFFVERGAHVEHPIPKDEIELRTARDDLLQAIAKDKGAVITIDALDKYLDARDAAKVEQHRFPKELRTNDL